MAENEQPGDDQVEGSVPQPDPTGPGTPNAEPDSLDELDGLDGLDGPKEAPAPQVRGPIPGTATTYGRDADALEAERKAALPPHVARAGHRADVAPDPPAGDPLGPPIRELPGEYETPDGYEVVQDLLETYHLHKSGAPRAQLEQLHGRLMAGARAWENRPNVEDPLGDGPIEG